MGWGRVEAALQQDLEHAGALLGEDARGRALVDDSSLFKANHLGAQQQSLLDIVSDGEYRSAELMGELLHAREQGVTQSAVDAGEGFVQQDEAGMGDGEGSGEVHALAFASGEIGRSALGQRLKLEALDRLIDDGCAGAGLFWGLAAGRRAAPSLGGEGDVLADGHVRKQDSALRSVGQLAEVRRGAVKLEVRWGWGAGACGAGKEVEDADRARRLVKKTADGPQDGALAASGGSEDDGPAGGKGEFEVEMESADMGVEPKPVEWGVWLGGGLAS